MADNAELRAVVRIVYSFRVNELKDALRAIGSSVSGLKDDLQSRLLSIINSNDASRRELSARAIRAVRDIHRRSSPQLVAPPSMKSSHPSVVRWLRSTVDGARVSQRWWPPGRRSPKLLHI